MGERELSFPLRGYRRRVFQAVMAAWGQGLLVHEGVIVTARSTALRIAREQAEKAKP
jgi:hypothetical protein